MKSISILLPLLPFACLANVDMVMGDAAQDELIISWSYNDSAFVGKYSGGVFTQVVAYPDLNSAAVALAFDESNGAHVLFLPYLQGEFGDYAEIFSYNYDDFTYQNTYQVENWAMNDRFGLLKTQDERWDALLAWSFIGFTSTFAEIRVHQFSYDIDTNGELHETDTASWTKYYYMDGERYSQYPAVMVGPVVCPGGYPLVATSFGNTGTQGWMMNHSLVFDPDSNELLCHTIGEGWDPYLSGVMGLGCSSDTEAILLFSDNSGVANWSLYTTLLPGPESTSVLPWGFPDKDDPVAFTSAGSLPGMLMVWYRDGEIRCRFWDGEWNNYDYHVTSSYYAPGLEEIAVCADTDGYWIAWLPLDTVEPEVVFIPAGSVTGVSDRTSFPVDPVAVLRPLSNPVRGSLSVEVQGVETGSITVLDISGRTILQTEADREGVHQLGELPVPGVYLIRMCHPGGATTTRVVSIK